jgi:hypothetical protein
MDIFLIPMDARSQQFEIDLAGRSLILESLWNGQADAWMLSMYDGITKDALFMNMPMVAGIDLLAPFRYLGIDGQLFVYTDGDETALPTARNLGAESNLYFVVP